ncbi:MAG TPA: hypothetical protein VG982_00895 [Candidatus Paceibacterota bacterium]|jgi:hypothetical protein|nr:hypothetical protein [Candidatus Paceibacterota bacterium]
MTKILVRYFLRAVPGSNKVADCLSKTIPVDIVPGIGWKIIIHKCKFVVERIEQDLGEDHLKSLTAPYACTVWADTDKTQGDVWMTDIKQRLLEEGWK